MKSLGDRIKAYEAATHYQLPPNQPLLIRVDGRAFHTYTRGMDRPFSQQLMSAMTHATEHTARDMAGFKLAYTQSDEATFLLTDFDSHDTQGWFGYDLNKVVSLSASLFTAHFNDFMNATSLRLGLQHALYDTPAPPAFRTATFDSRAFVVPLEDVPNVFVWRQKDWFRNSLSMLAQANFSHKQLHGKKADDMHQMLHEKGINWATDLSDREKNGTFVRRTTQTVHQAGDPVEVTCQRRVFVHDSVKADYDQIQRWI